MSSKDADGNFPPRLAVTAQWVLSCGALLFVLLLAPGIVSAQGSSAFNDNTVKFTPGSSRATIESAGAAFVQAGQRRIYIGTHQVTAINQNPVIASFTGDSRDWAMGDYETGGPDGRGLGLLWDGGGRLYAALTVDGGDGGGTGLERWCGSGWQTNYGSGGGPKATVLLRLDPATGAPIACTYVIARLSSGRTNTVVPTGLEFVEDAVLLRTNSFFSPLRVNKQRMEQTQPGSSPFDYRLLFTADLSSALLAEAVGWDGVTTPTVFGRLFSDGFEASTPLK